MKIVIQRVKQSSVAIDDQVVGSIQQGYMILVGVTHEDTSADVDYLVRKTNQLRIFEDADGKMNLDIHDIGGSILSISQFTLLANTKKGNRPSFIEAAKPDLGKALYQEFNEKLRQTGLTVETGQFGADMQVSLINDGPVTIMIDSKNR